MKRLLIAALLIGIGAFGCEYNKWQTLPVEGNTSSAGQKGDVSPAPTPVITPSAACGNGVVETGEACDDGNLADGDGCSALCATEVAVTPPPAECKEDGDECENTSDCCLGQCYFIKALNHSTCGLEPPPGYVGGGTPGGSGGGTTGGTTGGTINIEGSACTLYGPNHDTTSCPNGFNCVVDAKNQDPKVAVWNGVCKAWVDGVDYCSSDQACVDHHGKGWICTEDRDCQQQAAKAQASLTINSHYPDNGNVVYGEASITFQFNKPVDLAAVKAAFQVKEKANSQPFDYYDDISAKGTLSGSDGNPTDGYTSFTWSHYGAPFIGHQEYHYWILGGDKGLKAKDGSVITAGNEVSPVAYSWFFETN